MPAADQTNLAIAALTPLKVLVVLNKWEPPGISQSNFRAIKRAFQGGLSSSLDGSEEYYACGAEMGVDVRVWDQQHVSRSVRDDLNTCGHLLVIVLLEGDVSSSTQFGQWLNELAKTALQSPFDCRISILPIALDTDAERISLDPFNEFQRLTISDLGEPALRGGYLGLLALQQAWTLLGAGSSDRLQLFVSHAKRDGAPIALALRSQISSLRFLRSFYDAHDILPGTRWRQVLHDGVRKSVVVALRTDIYEQRPWCVQELAWAEEEGCPVVVVDARASLAMPRETLPLAGTVTVRVPDGNLVRILNSAMREAVRVRLFRRSVKLLEEAGVLDSKSTIALPRASLSALGVACEAALKDGRPIQGVVVAEPFREAERPAAKRLVEAYFPGATLGTLRDYAAHA